jgi:8-oxo-dGTP diphosphatase
MFVEQKKPPYEVVVTVDVAVLRQHYRGLELLLIKRGRGACIGQWALPGGKLDEKDQTLRAAAVREVREETGLELATLDQLAAFGDRDRDPRGRYVSILYVASVAFPESLRARSGDDAAAIAWFPISDLPAPLAFDHDALIRGVLRCIPEEVLNG